MTERFLALPEVRRLVGGLSKTQIYTRMGRDEFPRPVPLGNRRVAWLEREVREWMEVRIAERDLAQK